MKRDETSRPSIAPKEFRIVRCLRGPRAPVFGSTPFSQFRRRARTAIRSPCFPSRRTVSRACHEIETRPLSKLELRDPGIEFRVALFAPRSSRPSLSTILRAHSLQLARMASTTATNAPAPHNAELTVSLDLSTRNDLIAVRSRILRGTSDRGKPGRIPPFFGGYSELLEAYAT